MKDFGFGIVTTTNNNDCVSSHCTPCLLSPGVKSKSSGFGTHLLLFITDLGHIPPLRVIFPIATNTVSALANSVINFTTFTFSSYSLSTSYFQVKLGNLSLKKVTLFGITFQSIEKQVSSTDV